MTLISPVISTSKIHASLSSSEAIESQASSALSSSAAEGVGGSLIGFSLQECSVGEENRTGSPSEGLTSHSTAY